MMVLRVGAGISGYALFNGSTYSGFSAWENNRFDEKDLLLEFVPESWRHDPR